MNPCQSCGVCSWGSNQEPGTLKCDACESIALTRLVLGDGESTKPNRTERLVHTLLTSDWLDTHEMDTAESIVQFARDIERALDTLKDSAAVTLKPGFATVTWRDRASYLQWVERLTVLLEKHQAWMADDFLRCTGWEDIAVSYVLK